MMVSGMAQDVQFSQFYANPLYLNPALTGSHSGTYRLMSSYRNQWSGALENPFVSYTAGGDIKFTLRNKRGSYSGGNDLAAAGIQFFSDRVGQFDYNTNQISFFGAFHKLLGAKTNQYLSAGLQLGLGQRGINYEDLTFQDQFNGVDLFNGGTAETLPANALGYSDVSIGLHYSVKPKQDKGIYMGVAYHHFNKPNVSFFNNDVRLGDLYVPFLLESKLTVHGGASFIKSELLSIQPRAIYIQQGQSATAIIGSNLKYKFIDSDGIALHIGGWLRASDNLTTFQPTDVIISAAFQKQGLQVGFSYDHHLRKLTSTLLGQGIFELTISYVGDHDNENEICPQF